MSYTSPNPRFTSVSVGGAKNASAAIDVTSTTQGIGLPNMTTTQRDAISTPKAGLKIWNTTTSAENHYDGAAWQVLADTSPATASAAGIVTSFVPVVQSGVKTVSSANYTILDDDGFSYIKVTTGASDRTITLPTAADNAGRTITIKKEDTGAGGVIIDPEGAENIDSNATMTLDVRYHSITFQGDGVNWKVLSNQVPAVKAKYFRNAGYTPATNAIFAFDTTATHVAQKHISNSSGSITIAVAGVYSISCYIRSGTAHNGIMALFVDGSQRTSICREAGNDMFGTGLLDLDVGEVLTLRANSTFTITAGENNCWVSVYRVSDI